MVYLEKSPTNNALVIGIIAGVIVLAGLGVASVIIIKKKKANYELNKNKKRCEIFASFFLVKIKI